MTMDDDAHGTRRMSPASAARREALGERAMTMLAAEAPPLPERLEESMRRQAREALGAAKPPGTRAEGASGGAPAGLRSSVGRDAQTRRRRPLWRIGAGGLSGAAPPAAMAASVALGLLIGYGAPDAVWQAGAVLSLPEDPALDLAFLALDLVDGAPGTRP